MVGVGEEGLKEERKAGKKSRNTKQKHTLNACSFQEPDRSTTITDLVTNHLQSSGSNN